jgi:hypothetical protein
MLHANESQVTWNGRELSVTVQTDMGSVLCIIPREAIRGIAVYNDALAWEIERHILDIFDRLKHALSIKLTGLGKDATGTVILDLSEETA